MHAAPLRRPSAWALLLLAAGCGPGPVWQLTDRELLGRNEGIAVVLDQSLPLQAEDLDDPALLSKAVPHDSGVWAVAAALHFAPGPRPQRATLWLDRFEGALTDAVTGELRGEVLRTEADYAVDHFDNGVQLRFVTARLPEAYAAYRTTYDNSDASWTVAGMLDLIERGPHLDCSPSGPSTWTCETVSGRLTFRGPAP